MSKSTVIIFFFYSIGRVIDSIFIVEWLRSRTLHYHREGYLFFFVVFGKKWQKQPIILKRWLLATSKRMICLICFLYLQSRSGPSSMGCQPRRSRRRYNVSIPFSLKSGKLKLKEGRYRTRPSCVPSTLDGAVVTVPFL